MSDIRYNSWLHRSGTGGVYQDSSGKVGIGTSVPGGAGLHVKEGYSGLSAPNAHADTLYLENSGNAGVTIATPNTNTGYLTFADPDDDNIGQIIYRHNGNSMGFFVNAAERLRIDTDGSLMVGNTAAASMFSVANNLVVGSGSGSEGMTIFSDSTNDGYIVFADGTACVAGFQASIIKKNQRLYHNSGCASMGYDLPAAIGAYLATKRKTFCIAGDGSIMMNIQDLATIALMKLPVVRV